MSPELKYQNNSPAVLLISMPWTTQSEPSLGLSLLRAILDRQQISSRVLHLNLFLLEHLHAHTYEALARTHSLNEFLFSSILDPGVTNSQLRWLMEKAHILLSDKLLGPNWNGGVESTIERLLQMRNEIIPNWLNKWADEISTSSASLIGFTCMFDQTIASLSLGRMIKERTPDKMIVLGGYAVKSPTAGMILKSSPWISAVCDGEGEFIIGKLAKAATGEIKLNEVPGIRFRSDSGEIRSTRQTVPANLDNNPAPNFDDFFTDIGRMSDELKIDVIPSNLPVENSRGCWWGEKSHCIFCGIKDEDMIYRSRDHHHVLEHLSFLRQRYNIDFFRFTDYIMPHRYIKTLLPELVKLGAPYKLSTEMKANIKENQFALLAEAGFKEVQPGIESFNTDTLKKMEKGVTGIQNIFLLLLGGKYNVRILYNILYGFPGDNEKEYQKFVKIIPLLYHLDPPVTCVPVQFTRYAPMQTNPEVFGLSELDPEPDYELIFSREYRIKTGFNLEDYCYYFERPFEYSNKLQRIYNEIDTVVKLWQEKFVIKSTWLYKTDSPKDHSVLIHDKRGDKEVLCRLDTICSELLSAASHPVSISSLQKDNSVIKDPAKIKPAIRKLEKLGLIYRESNHILSLVLPNPPSS